MPLIIPQTTLTDDYQDFVLGGNLVGGNIQITANPATVQVQHGQQGFGHGVPELTLPLGSYSVGMSPNRTPLTGIRAKNAAPGLGSVLGAYFWTETDPTLSFIGIPSAQAVGAVLIPVVTPVEFDALTPVDEQVISFKTTDGVQWLLQWDDAAGLWRFIGGAPLFDQVLTSQGTTSVAYVDLATVGPSVLIDRIGTYQIEVGFYATQFGATQALMSYTIGGAAAVDADAARHLVAAGGDGLASVGWAQEKAIAADATTLTAKYRVSVANNRNFVNRWMRVTPVTLTP